MQMTHEQAQKLIQHNLDQALSAQEKAVLGAHLRDCIDCQTYANEMQEVDRLLFPAMNRQWRHQPIPLSMTDLIEKGRKTQASILLTTRKAAMGLIVLTLFFSVWQFVVASPSASGQLPAFVPPVPTPLAQTVLSTNTLDSLEGCEMIPYVVQPNDTLAGIADQFSISEEEIIAINSLKTKAIRQAMELVIPICNFTPTGTVHPVTFTITYTPIVRPKTSTPGG